MATWRNCSKKYQTFVDQRWHQSSIAKLLSWFLDFLKRYSVQNINFCCFTNLGVQKSDFWWPSAVAFNPKLVAVSLNTYIQAYVFMSLSFIAHILRICVETWAVIFVGKVELYDFLEKRSKQIILKSNPSFNTNFHKEFF